MKISPIAHIETNYIDKFGIPRQSGLVPSSIGRIVFEPKYRQEEAFRGLEAFSHIWLLWDFSESNRSEWAATVKPPRLGGKERMGVFATRSPFRPNPIGLSSVKLESIQKDENLGIVLYVSGMDMLDNTPIFDIKPYLSYCDSHPGAADGFAGKIGNYKLNVVIPDEIRMQIPATDLPAIEELLEEDPRPGYLKGKRDNYSVRYGTLDIHFTVNSKEKSLLVTSVDNKFHP
ncbi:MAG: tRNA (N6-threonylcarbamoyladenosine(37)-N6)-methyltransferase TrmO [Lachnospiraceae bacterium]